jgi:hexosaminidase
VFDGRNEHTRNTSQLLLTGHAETGGALWQSESKSMSVGCKFQLAVILAPVLAHAFAQAARQPELSLMPMPSTVTQSTGKLPIDSGFTVGITRYSDRRLEAAVKRFLLRISSQTGIPMANALTTGRAALNIECRAGGAQNPSLTDDESYQLDISGNGGRLTAATVVGALRGLATFSQLIASDAQGFRVPAVHIDDTPRFPWRGLMLDVSRHWMPLPVVERNLDAMAAVKLNVFHWHLSDDQGFRVESRRFPRLHQLGSDEHYYSQDEIRQVVAYARDRGIRVIPEFDVPAHTTAWFAGHPELASKDGPYQIERTWGIFQPTMDPSSEATYRFLDAFFGEMASLFPDEYFHIGGDEIEGTQWKLSTAIQSFAAQQGLKNNQELHAYFNRRVQALLTKHGKKMIGWDEVLTPGLRQDTVIQSWRGQASLADAARKSYRGILSWGYYLDHLRPTSFHYGVDPLDGAARELDQEQASRILGGEACMWSEYVSQETVDSRIWPRLAAIAERLWSPRDRKDVDSMYARMEAVSRYLEYTGIHHRSNYEPMLQRIAGAGPVEPVRVVADAVEPLGIEGRYKSRKYTSQVPLNRLVDAARPESEQVRHLQQIVARVSAAHPPNETVMAELRIALDQWSESRTILQPVATDNHLLAEVLPISESLSNLGSIGLRTLEYVQTRQAPPAEWIAQQRQILTQIEKPTAEVTLVAVRVVRMLLDAASVYEAKAIAPAPVRRDALRKK